MLCVVPLLFACGGPGLQTTQPTGETRSDLDPQVDFAYELQGTAHRLSELRGRPVLLVLMRTSEIPSQFHMIEVKEAFRLAAGRTRFLVLTIETSEAPFTALYVEAENLPFPIGVAEMSVGRGESAIGLVPAVPTTYAIDEKGTVVAVAPGVVKSGEIVKMIASVNKQ